MNGTLKKIKFAIVGFGHIGKRHAEMIDRHPEAELAAVIDINKKTDEHQVPFFSCLDSFLENNIKADVAIIATPNGLHANQALQCLDAGMHIIIEKPMALKHTDASAIIE